MSHVTHVFYDIFFQNGIVMAVDFHWVKNGLFSEETTSRISDLAGLRRSLSLTICYDVIYFECIETFGCEASIRISFFRKGWVVFRCKLFKLFNC